MFFGLEAGIIQKLNVSERMISCLHKFGGKQNTTLYFICVSGFQIKIKNIKERYVTVSNDL